MRRGQGEGALTFFVVRRLGFFAKTYPRPCRFVPRPCGPVPFLDSGHPALRPSGQLRCSRRSCGAVLVQRKGTKRKDTPSGPVSGLLPADCAIGLRGSLTVHPWTATTARVVRAPLRACPPPARRATRGPRRKSGALLRAEASRQMPLEKPPPRWLSAAGARRSALLCFRCPLQRRWTADEKARRGARRTRARSPRCRMHRRQTPADVHAPSA